MEGETNHLSTDLEKPIEEYKSYQYRPFDILEKKLIDVGMNKHEARVYVAILSLGKGTLTEVARKAGIPHVTTLFYLRILEPKGLIYRQEEGKQKIYYVRHPREGVTTYIHSLRKEADEKESQIHEFLEGLETKYFSLSDRPEVKFIEGYDVARRIQLEIAGSNFDEILSFTNIDVYAKTTPKKMKNELKQEFKKNRRKVINIYTSSNGAVLPKKLKRMKKYYIPKNLFDFPGELLIFGSKVMIISYEPRQIAVVINDKSMNKILSSLHRLALMGAEQFPENK